MLKSIRFVGISSGKVLLIQINLERWLGKMYANLRVKEGCTSGKNARDAVHVLLFLKT